MDFYLICEGAKSSLDVRVLDIIIAQKMGKMVRIEAGGGAASLPSVRSWLAQGRNAKVILIRDRDYLSENDVLSSRAQNAKWFTWSRHEIENFLIEPRIVSFAFSNLRNENVKLENLPFNETDVKNLLIKLVEPLLTDHIGAAFCETVKRTLSVWSIDCPQRQAITSKKDWLEHVVNRINETAQNYQDQFSQPTYTYPELEKEYDKISTRILAPEFLISGQFIQEVGGKQIKSNLLAYIHQQGMPISENDFDNLLLKALDALYQPGFFQPKDDFVELVNLFISNA